MTIFPLLSEWNHFLFWFFTFYLARVVLLTPRNAYARFPVSLSLCLEFIFNFAYSRLASSIGGVETGGDVPSSYSKILIYVSTGLYSCWSFNAVSIIVISMDSYNSERITASRPYCNFVMKITSPICFLLFNILLSKLLCFHSLITTVLQ